MISILSGCSTTANLDGQADMNKVAPEVVEMVLALRNGSPNFGCIKKEEKEKICRQSFVGMDARTAPGSPSLHSPAKSEVTVLKPSYKKFDRVLPNMAKFDGQRFPRCLDLGTSTNSKPSPRSRLPSLREQTGNAASMSPRADNSSPRLPSLRSLACQTQQERSATDLGTSARRYNTYVGGKRGALAICLPHDPNSQATWRSEQSCPLAGFQSTTTTGMKRNFAQAHIRPRPPTLEQIEDYKKPRLNQDISKQGMPKMRMDTNRHGDFQSMKVVPFKRPVETPATESRNSSAYPTPGYYYSQTHTQVHYFSPYGGAPRVAEASPNYQAVLSRHVVSPAGAPASRPVSASTSRNCRGGAPARRRYTYQEKARVLGVYDLAVKQKSEIMKTTGQTPLTYTASIMGISPSNLSKWKKGRSEVLRKAADPACRGMFAGPWHGPSQLSDAPESPGTSGSDDVEAKETGAGLESSSADGDCVQSEVDEDEEEACHTSAPPFQLIVRPRGPQR